MVVVMAANGAEIGDAGALTMVVDDVLICDGTEVASTTLIRVASISAVVVLFTGVT